jgi:hypothetical protein
MPVLPKNLLRSASQFGAQLTIIQSFDGRQIHIRKQLNVDILLQRVRLNRQSPSSGGSSHLCGAMSRLPER